MNDPFELDHGSKFMILVYSNYISKYVAGITAFILLYQENCMDKWDKKWLLITGENLSI